MSMVSSNGSTTIGPDWSSSYIITMRHMTGSTGCRIEPLEALKSITILRSGIDQEGRKGVSY